MKLQGAHACATGRRAASIRVASLTDADARTRRALSAAWMSPLLKTFGAEPAFGAARAAIQLAWRDRERALAFAADPFMRAAWVAVQACMAGRLLATQPQLARGAHCFFETAHEDLLRYAKACRSAGDFV